MISNAASPRSRSAFLGLPAIIGVRVPRASQVCLARPDTPLNRSRSSRPTLIRRKPWGWQLRTPAGGRSSCNSLAYAPDAAGLSARGIRSRTTLAEIRWCFVSPPASSGGIASRGGGSTRPPWIQAARRARAQCRRARSTAMGSPGASRLVPGVALHDVECRHCRAGRRVVVALHAAAGLDHLLLQPIGFVAFVHLP